MSRDSYPVDPPEDRSDDQSPLEPPFRLAIPERGLARSNKRILLRTTSEPPIVRREIRGCQKRSIPPARTTRATGLISFATRNSKPWPKWERFASSPLPISLVLVTAAMTARMEREIRRLKQQSLLSEKRLPGGRNKTTRLFALTKRGSRLVRKSGRVPDEQAIYHGFAEATRSKTRCGPVPPVSSGSRTDRIGGRASDTRVLDYELKRNLNRDLAALDKEGRSPEALEQIAERHGLSVVNGKIPVPDLRVEYDTSEMERQHVDLELATRNYRPRALGEKAKAGFSLYARREDTSRLRRVLDESEITARILSL